MATVYEKKNYTESDAVKQAKEDLTAQNALRPATYQSKWAPMAEGALNDILNRKDFQYDVNGDALYQQYKDRYVNLGQQAMMDTMGQAAQMTGGYGNSYAQMAGQQAYQGYLQGLTDKIPELYQLAMDRHNQQGQDLYKKYGLLSGQEQQDYGRYNDLMNAWLSERGYLAGRYDTERGYDYGAYRDSVGDDQWKAQFDEDIRRFDFAHNLGEFAPVAKKSSSDSGEDGDTGGDLTFEEEAVRIAKEYGQGAAIQWVSAQDVSKSDKSSADVSVRKAMYQDNLKKLQKNAF